MSLRRTVMEMGLDARRRVVVWRLRMRPGRALGTAALMWGVVCPISGEAFGERFLRGIETPAMRAGETVCAALDAAAMAHGVSTAREDLRVLAWEAGSQEPRSVGWSLTESGPAAVETAVLVPRGVQAEANRLSFDLDMPQRPYADLVLELRAEEFIATARVFGAREEGGARQLLGVFPVYALPGLGRASTLPLAETTLPFLHVELTLRDPAGRPMRGVRAGMIAGVTAPPSRLAQTLYTEVARMGAIATVPAPAGTRSIGVVRVPGRVPVERVVVGLEPGFRENFSREVMVMAWPSAVRQQATRVRGPVWISGRGGLPAAQQPELERVSGRLSRVRVPSGDPGLRPVEHEQMFADAVLGANLRDPATVEVAVENGTEAALPIRSISLLMRRRWVCFRAEPGVRYGLSYGGAVGTGGTEGEPPGLGGGFVEARLGPERRGSGVVAATPGKPYLLAHPETVWVALLALATALGGMALHRVKRAGGLS